jgi:hypothetical protein
MGNTEGKVTAKQADAANADTSLPDPTSKARWFLFVCTLLALGLAALLNWQEWTTHPFQPATDNAANFALFAGFYVAAQVIERMMELVSPWLPLWKLPSSFVGKDDQVKAAQVKADRAKATLGLAALAGVGASCAFGLYFLSAIGMTGMPHTADSFFTGITIAAGTKPLHDFISLIQNQNNPTTGTGTTAGTE